MTWNMFLNEPSGYFCCEPGTLGVIPSAGKSGGICEPSDQVVPASLLATKVSQVGAPTPTPTASVGPVNATTTGSGTPSETNPSLAATSTSDSGSRSGSSGLSGIESWSKAAKIGVGAGIAAVVIALIVFSSICNRRRRNRYAYGVYAEQLGGFDENGNRVPGCGRGYEPYRRMDRPNENNVTVNVVQGDMLH